MHRHGLCPICQIMFMTYLEKEEQEVRDAECGFMMGEVSVDLSHRKQL